MNPYLLPEGNVQIAFSGGRTSGFMLHQILEANGGLRDDVLVSFQNTGREMPQTLDYVQELGERWNVKIIWLEYRAAKPLFEIVSHNSASRNGEPFDQLIAKKQALPNQHQKFCSAELKTLTAKRYLRSIGWKRWTSAVGFRADEMHREAFPDNRATSWLPLRSANVTKFDVVRFWMAQPFDLRLPSFKGKTVDGNCDGCGFQSEGLGGKATRRRQAGVFQSDTAAQNCAISWRGKVNWLSQPRDYCASGTKGSALQHEQPRHHQQQTIAASDDL